MINPTVGRVILFYPEGNILGTEMPLAGLIAYVYSDDLINIGYFDRDGVAKSCPNVKLVHDDPTPITSEKFCCWMPYQKGQAAKAEALEKELADGK